MLNFSASIAWFDNELILLKNLPIFLCDRILCFQKTMKIGEKNYKINCTWYSLFSIVNGWMKFYPLFTHTNLKEEKSIDVFSILKVKKTKKTRWFLARFYFWFDFLCYKFHWIEQIYIFFFLISYNKTKKV